MSEILRNISIDALIRDNPHFSKSRLNSLYSNFENLRHLNPEGFEANIQAWSNLLIILIKSRILTSSKLSFNSFSPNIAQVLSTPVYGQPNGLGTIFNELVQRKVLVPYSLYKDSTESFTFVMNDSASMLDYLSPSKWFHWGIQQLGLTDTFRSTNKKGDLTNETYISWTVLCEVSQIYIKGIEKEIDNGSRSNLLFDKVSLYDFMKKVDPSLSQIDFEILFIYVSRDLGLCQTRYENNVLYIKFCGSEEVKKSITEEDIGIIKLKSTIIAIENRNEELEIKINDIANAMKTSLKNRNASNEAGVNIRLKNMLTTKKNLLASLEMSSSSLIQLTTTLMKINDATSNKNIFDLLSRSSKVLSALNDSIDLDDVDSLKIELEESYDKTNMISDALASDSTYSNDEELDEELKRLYEQESYNAPSVNSEKTNTNMDDLELIQKLENMKIKDGIRDKEEKKLEEPYH